MERLPLRVSASTLCLAFFRVMVFLGLGCLVVPSPTMTRFLFAELSGHYLLRK